MTSNDQSKNQSGQQNQPKSSQQAKQQQGQQAQQDSKPSQGQDANRSSSSNPEKNNLNKDQNHQRYTACSSVRSPAQAGFFFIAGLSDLGTQLPSGLRKD